MCGDNEIAVRDAIKFYYPDLDEKQLSICCDLIYFVYGMSGLRPMEHSIIEGCRNKTHLFSSADEVINTISELEAKNLLYRKDDILTIGEGERSIQHKVKILGFVRKEVGDLAFDAMSLATWAGKAGFF